MSDVKLGQLIDAGQRRDAVHVALAPVEAAENLLPGQHVGLNEHGQAVIKNDTIGIVDPFLTLGVKKGQWFWLCLYPGTVTSLRHQWTHPAFAGKVPGKEV